MSDSSTASVRSGYLFGLIAYTWWGLITLYFLFVRHVPAQEILAHRIVWSIGVLAILTTYLGNWKAVVALLRSRRLMLILALSAGLLALNWLLYIYAVVHGNVAEASLGYFMMPLVNAFLGTVFLGEKLRPAHYPALAIVAIAILIPSIAAMSFPWLAVSLTISFGFYGLVRKVTPVDSATGLMGETLILLPFSAAYLVYLSAIGTGSFGPDLRLNGLLALSGVVTVVPLVAFAIALKRLELLAISFIQHVSPTVQLLIAVLVLNETRQWYDWAALACVWVAVAIIVADAVLQRRRSRAIRKEREFLPIATAEVNLAPLVNSRISRQM